MQGLRFCTCVTAICVTPWLTWSVAGDADEPGTGFPIPNLLVCPANLYCQSLAQQYDMRWCLPPPSALLGALLITSLQLASIKLHLQICFEA